MEPLKRLIIPGKPRLEKQMSAAPPLVSLRTWYNDSADAESKSADAALQPLKRLIIPGNPWLENQMPLRVA